MFANLHDDGGIRAHPANIAAGFEMHVWVQSEARNLQDVATDNEGGRHASVEITMLPYWRSTLAVSGPRAPLSP